ncbi:pantetheine-phosphate adenylyltransferase [bacterium]|nr:pantetheine-phosphate adenylyltransferase [bacterium]
MKTAIYPGSFDPITKGHLDVLKKASKMFDKVIIAVLKNSSKKGFLPIEDRVKLIRQSVKDIENVEVDSFDGLTIEYARKKGANILIRGLRAVSDLEYEMQISQTNSALAPEIDTVFLITKPKYNFISSSIVKEIASTGGDVSKFVPQVVFEYLNDKYKERLK